MIPESAQLHELPKYWQNEITKIRRENARARIQLREARARIDELDRARADVVV
jgi:hypothetical protein